MGANRYFCRPLYTKNCNSNKFQLPTSKIRTVASTQNKAVY